QEFNLSVGEQPGLRTGDRNGPNRTALSQYRDAYGTAKVADRCHSPKGVVGVCVDIRDLRDTSLKYRTSRRAPPTWQRGIRASVHLEHIGGQAVVRDEVEELAVEPGDEAILGLAEARHALGGHVGHRLDVRQQATDDVEHLAGRGLVFESLGQLLRARLHLIEQPHVLNRDHRLVGEGLNQLDLLIGERLYGPSYERNHANRISFAQQGNSKGGPITKL